ncbi:hypothetical protein [Georgenia alba]|uniref:DUF2567 domain-containing protein n=1 Tax=Georgenia alba TaxID=2233858 RepID=A0ABW2Q8T2_9MICO
MPDRQQGVGDPYAAVPTDPGHVTPDPRPAPALVTPRRPGTVRAAVALMYLGAAVTVAVAILVLTGGVRAGRDLTLQDEAGTSGLPGSGLVVGMLATVVAIAILGVASVWLVMAITNRRGRRWARVVATVLAAFNLGNMLAVSHAIADAYAGVMPPGFDDPQMLPGLLPWLAYVGVGLAAVVLLWLPASSAYVRARARPAGERG